MKKGTLVAMSSLKGGAWPWVAAVHRGRPLDGDLGGKDWKSEGKSSIILEQRYRSDKTYPTVSTKMTWQNFERSLVVKRTELQFLIEEVFYRSPIFSGSRRHRLVHKTSEAETAPGQGIRSHVGLANKATLLSEKGNQSKLTERIDSFYFSEQQFFGEKATRWI